MTRLPSETDTPESLMPELVALRNEALNQADFESAVMLSHVHKWLHWVNENWAELDAINKTSK